ncbi:unnamed protein product [Mucor hiemalis]
MATSIQFPSASNQSKLSACPTTKLPEATDWIYQDFFNTMLNTNEYKNHLPSIRLSKLYPQDVSYYKNVIPETTFSEALLQMTAEPCHGNSSWDNCLDYRLCPTSRISYDQMSLPDLDNTKSSSDEEDEDDDDNSMIGTPSDLTSYMNIAPVLIESNISSCTTSSETDTSFRYTTETINPTLNKRKSTSSFQSLKSFMSAFSSSKKTKLYHNNSTALVKKNSMTGTLTKKFLKYFGRS